MKRMIPWLLIFSVVLSACQMNNQARQQQANNQDMNVQQRERVPQTAQKRPMDQDAQSVANRLVTLATSVPNVHDATAIVLGNIAIVGIDVDAKLDRPRVGTIKYSVAEALRKDPKGAQALVTADPDIVQRIREMNQDIRRGRPVAGFAEELADIAGRIMPQMPKNVQPARDQVRPGYNNQR